jgi:3D-(3,5/4)-trihydroxycyclohexane-1,2-dione acylhydrolase (decyclizing)
MSTIRLTMAQALTGYLARQMTEIDGKKVPFIAGVWAIFGHGNVAALGEALYQMRDELPTYRAHNEQAMAHAAIAFAKASFRRRMMAVTSSIGPGATNMVTAAAVAHVNRLPLLLLPGDVFANRRPDPVLQQIENFADGTVSANDCFRPVSRYFDRITRPEQIITALQRAMAVLTDPADQLHLRCVRTFRQRRSIIRRFSSPSGSGPSAASVRRRTKLVQQSRSFARPASL